MLERVQGPSKTPVTVAEVKDHLREDPDYEDAQIAPYLNAAVSLLDARGELGRAMIKQTWQLSVPFAPAATHPLWLELGDVLELVSVKYRDAEGALQSANLADFTVYSKTDNPYVLSNNWPKLGRFPDALQVQFAVGYGENEADVPENLRLAVKILAGHFYHFRNLVVTDQKLSQVPSSVDRLIAPYRIFWS